MKSLVTLSALLIAMPAAADLYKCPGPDGKIIYSDMPCRGEKLKIRNDKPDADSIEKSNTELKILRRQVFVGMKKEDLIRSWGEPTTINTTVTGNAIMQQWIYRRGIANTQYVYLTNGIVSSIQTTD